MLWIKKMKILIAFITYQRRHMFYVATRQKVDIDGLIIEKKLPDLEIISTYLPSSASVVVAGIRGLLPPAKPKSANRVIVA